MQHRWILAPPEELNSDAISWSEICGSECIARLLSRKGFHSAEEVENFLRPRLSLLSDPFLLPQMHAAVSRILAALDRHECIVLFGDYDVDGVTSLALLDEMLRAYGGAPELFLPLRMEEGYGLSRESIERCLERNRPQLLIAVDCGTSSVNEIAELKRRGVAVIVLDHHEPKSELPDCVAIVNPKLTECGFEYLSSVGIVFKLCHALLKMRPLPGFDLKSKLDLVALGTVADTTEEAWDMAFDVNLRTAFLASKYAVPVMAARGRGAIVNIASISALRGDGTVAYSAAKGGLIAMTVDMAYSHGRQGIRVNAVAPGHITTPMVLSVSAASASRTREERRPPRRTWRCRRRGALRPRGCGSPGRPARRSASASNRSAPGRTALARAGIQQSAGRRLESPGSCLGSPRARSAAFRP